MFSKLDISQGNSGESLSGALIKAKWAQICKAPVGLIGYPGSNWQIASSDVAVLVWTNWSTWWERLWAGKLLSLLCTCLPFEHNELRTLTCTAAGWHSVDALAITVWASCTGFVYWAIKLYTTSLVVQGSGALQRKLCFAMLHIVLIASCGYNRLFFKNSKTFGKCSN